MSEKNAKLNIEQMPIGDLVDAKADYNPRDIEDDERDGLRFSMGKFGYVENIIYNKTTGRVVSGHQRIDVLRDEGYETIDVNIVELSEEDEKKLNVVMNSNTVSGDFTFGINDMLEGILDEDPEFFDMTGLSLLFLNEESDAIDEEEKKNDEVVKGMDLMPYESYDCVLVVCKRRDDFMFLSSKLGLGEKVVISSPVVSNKKLGYTRCVDAGKLIESFGEQVEKEDEFNL